MPCSAARMQTSLKARLGLVSRALSLVVESSRAGTAMLFSLTFASALLPLGVAYGGKRIIDAVIAGARGEALWWVGVELVFVAATAAAQRALSVTKAVLGARLSIDINVRILEKALTLELRHFEDPTFYDQLTRARREASSRPIAMVSQVFELCQNALSLLGFVGLLVQVSGSAVAFMLLAAVPATLAEVRYSAQAFRLRTMRAPETRRLTYLEYVIANDAHAKEVKSYGLGPLFLGRYREMAERVYEEDRRLSLSRAGAAVGLSLLATLAFYALYAHLAGNAASGLLSVGNLTLYVVAFRQGQGAFQAMLGALGGMYEHTLYLDNLFGFFDARGDEAPRPRSDEVAPSGGGAEIRFEGLRFRYPGAEREAVAGVDLVVSPGEHIGLVGLNGSGKSTLLKLLTRLYRPTEGRVLIDGRDVAELADEGLRRRFAVVFQDFNRYQLDLGENVGVGSVPHMGDEARVERAIESSGAGELRARLSKGLATPLGRWFRNEGVELSGGEWQRVAVARGFMRQEADVLILDEPTAALDAEAEQALFARLRELSAGKTTFFVSHRLSSVRTADRIVVLAEGKVAEMGTHDELMASEGRYAKLFRMQAQGYL